MTPIQLLVVRYLLQEGRSVNEKELMRYIRDRVMDNKERFSYLTVTESEVGENRLSEVVSILRRWVHAGMVKPHEDREGISFAIADNATAKVLGLEN